MIKPGKPFKKIDGIGKLSSKMNFIDKKIQVLPSSSSS